ncbi:efflux RND transporter periplasmic adaptor subunit [Pseudotamlana carrageenivorans]|uniref:Efflux RND transporter periplasmic adaptor subunit n=1 Tax=Pseudotamlana carrageenivorans TaxID=2069432 RepID=A0A2I7SGH5_9FLAO|nr:efflux RND transporter periplasmic adaptor subunit [Tamlana carrageenivorans]AUS05016.1 efflux RND transporter periplasmic adaptor subunit [Tamlana carrageenivorans]
MKNIYTLLLASVLFSSCGSDKKSSVEAIIATNDLEKIRQKHTELEASAHVIATQLKEVEDAIKALNPQSKIPLITTFKANEAPFKHYVELQGNVSTNQNIVIYPEFSGVLTSVYVKEGQQVKKGQILAKIDDGGLSQQLAQLKIQASLAQTTYERQDRLWQQKIGSEMQYLQAKANYEAQTQAVNQLEQQIGKTQVRAPFSGTIDDVITDQGSVVAPGQTPLIRIVNLDDMYIESDVPESYVSSIVKGKDVQVYFPVLEKKIKTKVRQSGNYINPANRTFKVEIALPSKDESILPNLTARLKINDYTSEKAILIPQSIISENAEGQQYVYTITDKDGKTAKAHRTIIQTGKTQGDFIEILSGIENGQEIIDEGARTVKEGQDVKILEIK